MTHEAFQPEAARVTYDRGDYHYDSTIAAGQPARNAFAHIGLYLAWAIRRRLHDPEIFRPEHVSLIDRGEMTGSDLEDEVDGKLHEALFTPEGRAFTGARYDDYLAAYAAAFADRSDYSVVDDAQSYARIAPALDGLYAAWIAAGRPLPPPEPELAPAPVRPRVPPLDFAAAVAQVAASIGARVEVSIIEHAVPALERLIPADLSDPPLEIQSVVAAEWGSSLLDRALKILRCDPRHAVVVTAMGGGPAAALAVTLYSVPGSDAGTLYEVMRTVVARPPGTLWSERSIDGTTVSWADGLEFTAALWARDGLAVAVAGNAAHVARAYARLPR